MNFIDGLLKTINDGVDLFKVDKDNEEKSISLVWDNILSILIGCPIVLFAIISLISSEFYSSIEYLIMFANAYLFLLAFSIIFRLCGVSYLGTYKYIYKYITNK